MHEEEFWNENVVSTCCEVFEGCKWFRIWVSTQSNGSGNFEDKWVLYLVKLKGIRPPVHSLLDRFLVSLNTTNLEVGI